MSVCVRVRPWACRKVGVARRRRMQVCVRRQLAHIISSHGQGPIAQRRHRGRPRKVPACMHICCVSAGCKKQVQAVAQSPRLCAQCTCSVAACASSHLAPRASEGVEPPGGRRGVNGRPSGRRAASASPAEAAAANSGSCSGRLPSSGSAAERHAGAETAGTGGPAGRRGLEDAGRHGPHISTLASGSEIQRLR